MNTTVNREWIMSEISSDTRTLFTAHLLAKRWHRMDKSVYYRKLYRRVLYHMNKLVEQGRLVKYITAHNDSIFIPSARFVPLELMEWYESARIEHMKALGEIPF